MGAFLLWTAFNQDAGGVKVAAEVIAAGAFGLAAAVPVLVRRQRDGWAFTLSAGAIALLFTSLFVGLYPDALPSSTGTRVRPDARRGLRQPLQPDSDDRRGRDLRADRPRLPGLDLLGLSPPPRTR